MDKKRANYYSYFTDKKWNNMENYSLTIKSSDLGIDGCVELLKNIVQQRQKQLENK